MYTGIKIKHDFVRTGCTIRGRILGVYWNGFRRGGDTNISHLDHPGFTVRSYDAPDIYNQNCLKIWGTQHNLDLRLIEKTFDCEQTAIKFMNFIDAIRINTKEKETVETKEKDEYIVLDNERIISKGATMSKALNNINKNTLCLNKQLTLVKIIDVVNTDFKFTSISPKEAAPKTKKKKK